MKIYQVDFESIQKVNKFYECYLKRSSKDSTIKFIRTVLSVNKIVLIIFKNILNNFGDQK